MNEQNNRSFNGASCANTGNNEISRGSPSCKISYACKVLNTFGSKKIKSALPLDYEPTPNTVVLGRRSRSDSPGNQRLREIVQSFFQLYQGAQDKVEKSAIVTRVVNMIQEECPESPFVIFEKGKWHSVGERAAREKIGSYFRDCLKTSQSKAAIRQRKAK